MATNNRGGKRRSNRGKNNNPEGHNQYDRGWSERPLAAALGAAAAVGAGIFLWSRRDQISDQIGDLAEQLGEMRERGWTSGDSDDFGAGSSDGRSQREIAEEALTLKEIGAATEPGQPPA